MIYNPVLTAAVGQCQHILGTFQTLEAMHWIKKIKSNAPNRVWTARNANVAGVADKMVERISNGTFLTTNVSLHDCWNTIAYVGVTKFLQMRAVPCERNMTVVWRRFATGSRSLGDPIIKLWLQDSDQLWTYRMSDASTEYDKNASKNAAKMLKTMTVHIKSCAFDLFNPILILGFLKKFKLAWKINGIQ